ncbi:hypothetical protein D3C86_2014570 [compost metagenome]
MPTRLSASGRSLSPSTSWGSSAGSVVAFLIFLAMASASSSREMRDWSDGSDLLIFLVPSRRLMMRVAGPAISGSVMGKKVPSSCPAPWAAIEAA